MDTRSIKTHFIWAGSLKKVEDDPTLFIGPNSLSGEIKPPNVTIELWLPASEISKLGRLLTHPENVHVNKIEDLWEDPDVKECFSKERIQHFKYFYELLATGMFPAIIVQKVLLSFILMAAKGDFYFDTTFNFGSANLDFFTNPPKNIIFPMQRDDRDSHERFEKPLIEVFMFFSPDKKNPIFVDILKEYFYRMTNKYDYSYVPPFLNLPNAHGLRLNWIGNHIPIITKIMHNHFKKMGLNEENFESYLNKLSWKFILEGNKAIFENNQLEKTYRNVWRNDFEEIRNLFKDLSKDEIEQHPAFLLSKDENFNIAHYAALKGQLEFLKFLANKGVALDSVTQKGETLAHFAAYGDELEVLLFLPESLLNQVKKDGQTLAHFFAGKGNAATLNALTGRIDLNKQDVAGATPLNIAAQQNQLATMKFLLAEPSVRERSLNQADHEGNTPIHFLAEVGLIAGLELFAEAHADFDLANNLGDTPLYMAVNNNQLAACKFLLDQGVDVMKRTQEGYTALDLAEANGFTEIAELLKGRLDRSLRP